MLALSLAPVILVWHAAQSTGLNVFSYIDVPIHRTALKYPFLYENVSAILNHSGENRCEPRFIMCSRSGHPSISVTAAYESRRRSPITVDFLPLPFGHMLP